MSDSAISFPAKAGRFFLQEFRLVLPPTLYFFLAFNIIVLTTNLLTAGYWFRMTAFMTATALALIVGKVILVVDKVRLIDRFKDAPLIKPILYKTAFYTLVVTLVRLVEVFVHVATDDRGMAAGWKTAVDAFTWHRFIAIQIWLLTTFLIYVAWIEVARTMGEGGMRRLLFHRRAGAKTG